MAIKSRLGAILKRPVVGYLVPPVALALVLALAFFAPANSNIFGKLASCSSASLSAAPPTLTSSGATVVETASATCQGGYGYPYGAGTPKFRFWEFDPGSRWSMVQDFSTTNTHNWNTTGLPNGDYRLEVDVLSIDEPNSKGYDVVSLIHFIIGPAPCLTAGLAVAPPSGTGATGGTMTMTGSSTGCTNPVYRFWIFDAGGTRWSMVQDYSATTTHTWGPVGTYHVGQYKMEVDVRDAAETTTYDVVNNITYNLVGCTGATIVGAPASPQTTGAGNVTLTATATCPGTAQFRFWIMDAGSRWSMVQDYSASNTYTWAAGNQRMGVAHIEVDVRDVGSQDTYEFATQGQTYSFT